MIDKLKGIFFTIGMAIFMPLGYALATIVGISIIYVPFILADQTFFNFSYPILMADCLYVGFIAFVLIKYGHRISPLLQKLWKQIRNNY